MAELLRRLVGLFAPVPQPVEVRAARRERRTMLVHALRGRCPLCGTPGIRLGWAGIRERCPGCNFRFSRERGYLTGAVWFNLTAAFIALWVVLVGGAALLGPGVSWGALTMLALGAMTLAATAFQPLAVALWLWLDLAFFRPLNAEDLAANDPPARRRQPPE